MRYRVYAAMIIVAAVFVSAFGFASAADVKVGAKANGLSICEESYLSLYDQAQQKFGSGAVGANVVDDGVGKYAAYNLPESLCKSKAATLDAMLHPPPPPAPVTTPTYSEAVVPTTTTSGTAGAIPSYITECESGGDYSASNPSGAYGAYQIMPGTAASYGCDLSTPGGQDACASEIYAAEGASAWDCG